MLTQVRAETVTACISFFRRGLRTAGTLCSSCSSAPSSDQPHGGGCENDSRSAGVAQTNRLQAVLLLPGGRTTGRRRGSELYNRQRDLHLPQPDPRRVVRF